MVVNDGTCRSEDSLTGADSSENEGLDFSKEASSNDDVRNSENFSFSNPAEDSTELIEFLSLHSTR